MGNMTLRSNGWQIVEGAVIN